MTSPAKTSPLLWALAEELAKALGGRPTLYLKAARQVLARTLGPVPTTHGHRRLAIQQG